MRAVIQRVKEASVTVEDEIVGQIGAGYLVLVGVNRADTLADAQYIADKIVNLRIFEDDQNKMNLSLVDTGGAALIVSQFTLYGDARKGRRPGFVDAMGGDEAKLLYNTVCELIAAQGIVVQRGTFGAHMDVRLWNDGPVTILLDSSKLF